ncbi:MAG: Crp/Fnr family transcriptional regulator, partial [Chitinophagaceae bacterium]|nr:Crp/Fnr family transcriptional regulator [Chitinophagaceae bacterium]
SFIGEESYNCTAIAISEVCLCFLKHDLIQQLFKSNSDLPFQFMKVLANDLKTSETKILHLTQNTVRERIAESILLLAEFYGTEDDGITINVSLKRDELAGIAGTIRESAIRTLYEFNESNIIELTGKKIKILDAQKLQRIANASL